MNRAAIDEAIKIIEDSEFILIGGGAGLSAAAGLDLDGEHFVRNFAEFIAKYGIRDLYSGGFYPYPTLEEKWAFWAKHIFHSRYEINDFPLYKTLFSIVKNKPYFVISTNVDGIFVKSGFPDDKVFEIQGDYKYFQCSKPCHNMLYDNEKQIREMVTKIKDCRIPHELIPKCPVCGAPMDYNLRVDNRFVQDNAWYQHQETYQQFLEESFNRRLVLLEMGVGYNTPAIIRFPFEQIARQNKNSHLIRFNKDYPDSIDENMGNLVSFTENMAEVINEIARRMES